MNFRPFRFQAKITFGLRGVVDAIHKFAIHGEFDTAIDGNDIIRVPFSSAVTAILNRFTSLSSWVIRNGFHTADCVGSA